jgi:UDP-glucose 4-epimerase
MLAPSCLVLGGSGFLGSRLCRSLVDAGFAVRSVSRSGRPKRREEAWWKSVQWIKSSIGSPSSLEAVIGCEFIVHLSSTTLPSTSNEDVLFDIESNVVSTIQVLQSAVAAKVKKIVFISSGGTVYGNATVLPISENHATDPICSYGIHKLMIEKYLQLFRSAAGLDSIILRVANIYGESQSCEKPIGAVAHFTARAIAGVPIEIWGDGTVIRDYTYVDDVVKAIMKALAYTGKEKVFNIGTGCGVSLNGIISLLQDKLLLRPVSAIYLPKRGFDVSGNVLDVARARTELGWTAEVGLNEGIDRIIHAEKVRLAECP